MKNEVKVCKLVSGELIIGEFTEIENINRERNYDIVSPMHIMFQPGPTEDQIGVGLVQYIPFLGKDGVINIDDSKVLCWVNDYPENIKAQFIKNTSGIILPPSKPELSLV